jgi:hypothetical protein
VDSAGDTIDFMLAPKRDLIAAKLFLRLALSGTGGIQPRVIHVDGHRAYASAIAELARCLSVHVIDWVEDTIDLPCIPLKTVASRWLTERKAKVDQTAKGIRITVPPEDRQAADTIVMLETNNRIAGHGSFGPMLLSQRDPAIARARGKV